MLIGPDFIMNFETTELKVNKLLSICQKKNLLISIAESCTGGLICSCLTSLPGASAIFDRGFITYTNQSKQQLLGVSDYLFRDFGSVSKEVALAMVEGVMLNSYGDIALSVTGIAGPEGGSDLKPVGLVYIGAVRKGFGPNVSCHHFAGDRSAVRESTLNMALDLLIQLAVR
jgi:nicotinamide-nucleotide amidase